MKKFFRAFMVLLLVMAFVGVIDSYTTDQPWPGETFWSWTAVAFFGAIWGGTEWYTKHRNGGVW